MCGLHRQLQLFTYFNSQHITYGNISKLVELCLYHSSNLQRQLLTLLLTTQSYYRTHRCFTYFFLWLYLVAFVNFSNKREMMMMVVATTYDLYIQWRSNNRKSGQGTENRDISAYFFRDIPSKTGTVPGNPGRVVTLCQPCLCQNDDDSMIMLLLFSVIVPCC